MRVFKAIVIALLLAMSASVNISHASCPKEGIQINVKESAPSAPVTINGRFECRDEPGDTDSRKALTVTVLFVQGGTTVEIGRVNTDYDSYFKIMIYVPSDAKAGPAVIIAKAQNGSQRFQHEASLKVILK